ncbi:hypothetical protein ACJMK2_036106 [Sinanodonta woodiana]|uniref:BHLH domain-containing protein n=1 Tax=Sinanodonta woodiana TaxID=1069815 RepID=A0ABD3WG69_SINWO
MASDSVAKPVLRQKRASIKRKIDYDESTQDFDLLPEHNSVEDVDIVADEDIEMLKSKLKPEYNLRKRTLVVRLKTEKRKESPKQPKPKSSPAPLSKYRRRVANARERGRMQDINEAFQKLENVLPDEGKGPKVTKVMTLRFALQYIAALRRILGYDETSTPTVQICESSEKAVCTIPVDTEKTVIPCSSPVTVGDPSGATFAYIGVKDKCLGESQERMDAKKECFELEDCLSKTIFDSEHNDPMEYKLCPFTTGDSLDFSRSESLGSPYTDSLRMSDGESVRSSSISSGDDSCLSPLDGDILQGFSFEDFELECTSA